MLLAVAEVVMIGIATGVISLTVTKALVFKWLRMFMAEKTGVLKAFLGKLFTCPLCMSFWVSMPFVLTYQPRVAVGNIVWLDVLLSYLATIMVAAIAAGLIYQSYKPLMEE